MNSIRRLSDDGGTVHATAAAERSREVFRDCALVEIIHLHDCLRGAVKSLEQDVQALTAVLLQDGAAAVVADLEGRVLGRFKVIWSVFRAHSTAEDEFIWPALRRKTQALQQQAAAAAAAATTSNKIPPDEEEDEAPDLELVHHHAHHHHAHHHPAHAAHQHQNRQDNNNGNSNNNIVQEEYEEDHADEERMFSEMDSLLGLLKERLQQARASQSLNTTTHNAATTTRDNNKDSPQKRAAPHSTLATSIMEQTQRLSNHLLRHLEKEEVHCMPLVLKHLDKTEIENLVGEIMGRRSADTITHIMTMAVQSLEEDERNEMIKYMKQSMRNTFFDKWLLASGWGSSAKSPAASTDTTNKQSGNPAAASADASQNAVTTQTQTTENVPWDRKRPPSSAEPSPVTEKKTKGCLDITTQAELERLIRAIATNPALSAQQKNTTIQGLRDSVWKKNQQARLKREGGGNESPPAVPVNGPLPGMLPLLSREDQQQQQQQHQALAAAPNAHVARGGQTRALPPAKYYKKNAEGIIELKWSNESNPLPGDGSVPTFSASELAPTYHDGAAGAVFGCPHYSRACKLRHPKSGRLYTCRLCCDHQRELPMREDEPLDRYAVSEVFCMVCTTLQPTSDRCINPDCASAHKPFARYFCRICHLYDDGSRPIFHCPYCNTCRLGLGLGIDFRHCMRCNACVSLVDKEHRCIPQKLQGDCPICHESLFQSTEPLRGVKCGHVMHLSCFTQYRRNRYTCPLCCKSMEDMKDHFSLLDAAIRMQPMPATFLNTLSNIYCQDCGQTGQVPYHFAGLKCAKCSSYNTREMGRVQNT